MGFQIENSVLIKYTKKIWEKSVTIPDGVTSIGKYAFAFCSHLKSINIPDSVNSIRYRAFYKCSSLKSIKIPDSVTSIRKGAFEGCSNLKSITIPETLTDIAEDAFYICSPDLKIIRRKSDFKKADFNKISEKKIDSKNADYRELFIKSFYAVKLSEIENILNEITDDNIKIPFSVLLFTKFQSQKARDYIVKNYQKVMHYLIDKNDMESISKILPIVK